MIKKNVLTMIFVITTLVFAGAFGYSLASFSSEKTQNNSLTANYDNQQGSVVLRNAFSHWNDIAIENVSLLANQYESNATLHWIGGPLTGTYTGNTSILQTWGKFFNLWSAVWFYAEAPPVVNVSGNSASVISSNQFIVTPFSNPFQVQYIDVSYILNFVFQNNTFLISNEVWHITGSGLISFAQESYEYNQISNLAFSHWNNIAIENTSLVMQEYASNATLHWVNGALKGNYTGTSQINNTWTRFFNLWNAIWFYSESPPSIMINGSIATVMTTIQFVVQSSSNLSQFDYINVTYSIQYLDLGFNPTTGYTNFEIVNEIFDNTALGPLSKV